MGSYATETTTWTRPEDMTGTARPSYSITSANSGADVAAASAAALAATSVALQSANYAQASEALAAAEDLYAFAKTVIPAFSTPGCTASQTEGLPSARAAAGGDVLPRRSAVHIWLQLRGLHLCCLPPLARCLIRP